MAPEAVDRGASAGGRGARRGAGDRRGGLPVRAQAPPGVLRLALLPQWVDPAAPGGRLCESRPCERPSKAASSTGPSSPGNAGSSSARRSFRSRSASCPSPRQLRSVAAGGSTLGAVRPPTGRAAWTEVEVGRSGAGADDVLLLEIGGERNTVTQVLETLLVADPARGLVEVPLARPALHHRRRRAGRRGPLRAAPPSRDGPAVPRGGRDGPPRRPEPAVGRARRRSDGERPRRHRAAR